MYVYDNNSTDETVVLAARAGAEYLQGKGNVLVLIFLWSLFENICQPNRRKRFLSALGAITVLVLIFYTSFYNAYFLLIYAFFLVHVYVITLFVKKLHRHAFQSVYRFVKAHLPELLFYIVFGVSTMVPFLLIYLPTLRSNSGWDVSAITEMLPGWRDFFNVSPYNIVYGSYVNGAYFHQSSYAGELRTGFPFVMFVLFILATFWMYFHYAKKSVPVKKTGAPSAGVYLELLYFAATVLCCFAVIIKMHGHSIWYILYRCLPGASALRAVSRFNMFLTLPVGLVCAIFVDRVFASPAMPRLPKGGLLAVLCCWLVIENTLSVGVLSQWTITDSLQLTQTAAAPPADCQSVFIIDTRAEKAFTSDKEYQLAAWEIANHYGIYSINGHSGQFPPGWKNMSPYHGDAVYALAINAWIARYQLENVYAYDIHTNIWTACDAQYKVHGHVFVGQISALTGIDLSRDETVELAQQLAAGDPAAREILWARIQGAGLADETISNEQYVSFLYLSILGRAQAESPEENRAWAEQLQNGSTRKEVFIQFLRSTEFTNNFQ